MILAHRSDCDTFGQIWCLGICDINDVKSTDCVIGSTYLPHLLFISVSVDHSQLTFACENYHYVIIP